MIRFPNIKLASNFFQKIKFYDTKDIECNFLKFFRLDKTYIYKKLNLFNTVSITKKNPNFCKLNSKKSFYNLIKTSKINLKCVFNKSLFYNFLIDKKNKSFTTLFNCIFLKTLI